MNEFERLKRLKNAALQLSTAMVNNEQVRKDGTSFININCIEREWSELTAAIMALKE